jgi:putative ABC transport system ATP-binding protein
VIIELKGITKFYEIGLQTVKALDGIDLSIAEHEFVSIMGQSGSGKSTLMNIIGCLDVPSSGSYSFEGTEVSELHDNELAQIRGEKIGFVFQTFNLLPRVSALKNVELPMIYYGFRAKERKRKALKALEEVGLADRIDHKPNELSGGQKQRVAIARALVNEPSIILADEPTGNLDSKTGDEIMDLFMKLHEKGNTFIIVTHEKQIADYTKRIIRLKDGKILDDKSI